MGNNCTSQKKYPDRSEFYKDESKIPQVSPRNQEEKNALVINNALFVKQILQDPLEKYEIMKFLGEGSFGTVHLVKNIETGIERAMKEIKKNTSKISQSDTEIINEIEILKKIDHPNIVKIFEFYVTSQKYYIITEYCPEQTLYTKIKKYTRFSEDQAANIIFQLLSAVNYCHSNQIVHRDLKPENILIDRTDKDGFYQIKVIDFGTAKIFDSNKKERKFIGSCYYIAPEVIKKNYNEKCDLWSCGVILYILICGYAPFLGKIEHDIYSKILSGKFDLTLHIWKKTSDEVKDLIKSLIHLSTKSRLSANEALNHSWFKKWQIRDNISSITENDILNYINNLMKYNPENKLQQAVIGLIVHRLPHSEEINEIKSFFHFIDYNRDGAISKSEFKTGIAKFLSNEDINIKIDTIFSIIDADNSGFIDYIEFITACINKEKLILNEELLKMAFNFFDKDDSGGITLDELIHFFFINQGDEVKVKNKKVLESILFDIDSNNDGEISYKEFHVMMKKIILS